MVEKVVDSTKVFGTFPITEDLQLRVTLVTYRGERKLDIRQHWLPEGGEYYTHTKRGVRIPREVVPQFLEAVIAAAKELMVDPGEEQADLL